MDWTQCVICQQVTSEPLRCPLKAGKPGHKSEAYSSFLQNVTQFTELDQLPVPLNFGKTLIHDKSSQVAQVLPLEVLC